MLRITSSLLCGISNNNKPQIHIIGELSCLTRKDKTVKREWLRLAKLRWIESNQKGWGSTKSEEWSLNEPTECWIGPHEETRSMTHYQTLNEKGRNPHKNTMLTTSVIIWLVRHKSMLYESIVAIELTAWGLLLGYYYISKYSALLAQISWTCLKKLDVTLGIACALWPAP